MLRYIGRLAALAALTGGLVLAVAGAAAAETAPASTDELLVRPGMVGATTPQLNMRGEQMNPGDEGY
jgi:hypothetical protein